MSQWAAFALSLALETPVALAFAFFGARIVDKRGLSLVFAAALLGTTITHPFVWTLNERWLALAPWPRLIVLELGAFLVEALVYLVVGRMRPAPAFATSLLANAFSFGIGLVIFYLLLRRAA